MALPLSRAAIARVVPFVAFVGVLAVRGVLPVDAGIDPRWVHGVAVLVAGALLVGFWREYGELVPQTLPGAGEVALAIGVGALVFALGVHLDAPWMRIGEPGAGFVPTDDEGRLLWPLVAVRWLGASLLVPVIDELFWRSFLMRWLQSAPFESVVPQQVGPKAIVLSTFVFMLAHPLWLAAVIAGLALAWLYVRTGKLWVPVIAHAVMNALLGLWVLRTQQWALW